MNKTCKQCQKEFIVEDDDLEFYKKISPTFDGPEGAPLGGKVFEIPSPTLCRECRSQRRLVWRNEKKLYKRKSDLSDKSTISVFSPDKPYKIFTQDEWSSDAWDPMEYGQDYDLDESFFSQFDRLYKKVPKAALVNINNENSDYLSYARGNKDSYLLFSAIDNEDCHYSTNIDNCQSSVDSLMVTECNLCYEAVDSQNCYECRYIQECRECVNSAHLFDCKECDHCLFCSGLRHKSYYAFNEKISKEEFEELSKNLEDKTNLGKFQIIKKNTPRRCAKILKSENVSGDNIANSKNCRVIFDTYGCEECAYLARSVKASNCFDCDYAMANYCMEGLDVDQNASKNIFCVSCWYGSNVYYSINCYSSNNLFGCVGLRHKEYCIFNKQYSKEEYEKKVGEIIVKMQEAGEWGEFFPMSISPFGYNETVANEYFNLDKESAEKLGAKWQDDDFGLKFDGPFYEPKKDIQIYAENEKERQELLNGILKCEISGKPFKITPQELALYIKMKVQIPTKHYDVRYQERFDSRNPRKLWHRKCMNEGPSFASTFAKATVDKKATDGRCPNEFETTYAPDRPERVFCESCYQKSVI